MSPVETGLCVPQIPPALSTGAVGVPVVNARPVADGALSNAEVGSYGFGVDEDSAALDHKRSAMLK